MGIMGDLNYYARERIEAPKRAAEAKAQAEAKAAADKEIADSKTAEAEASAAAAKTSEEIARLESEMRRLEAKAHADRIDEVARARAARKGRPMKPEDRSWAARAIAKVRT